MAGYVYVADIRVFRGASWGSFVAAAAEYVRHGGAREAGCPSPSHARLGSRRTTLHEKLTVELTSKWR